MKIEPIILNRIQTKHTNYVVDIQLDSNVTFITGDAGTGKTLVFSMDSLKENRRKYRLIPKEKEADEFALRKMQAMTAVQRKACIAEIITQMNQR